MRNLPQIAARTPSRRSGFTLIEALLAAASSAMTIVVIVSVMVSITKPLRLMNLQMQADQEANLALSRMVYGVDSLRGLRVAAAQAVKITGNNSSWQITYSLGQRGSQTNTFNWSQSNGQLILSPGKHVVGRDIAYAPKPTIDSGVIGVTMRVDKVVGKLKSSSTVSTAICCRNDDTNDPI